MKKIYLRVSGAFFLIIITASQLLAQNGVTVAGGNGAGTAFNQFDKPQGVMVDAAGNIFVADFNNHRVEKWAPGASQGIVVAGRSTYNSHAVDIVPYDVFIDSAGNLYVSDLVGTAIRKYAPGDTTGIIAAGGNGPGAGASQIDSPYGLYVDASGTIYVANNEQSRVDKWPLGNTVGITILKVNSQTDPKGEPNRDLFDVTPDLAGNILIADANLARILKLAPGATVPTIAAGGNGSGSAANQLSGPLSMCVDAGSNIYIADAGNNRIQKLAPGATSAVTVAGGNGAGSAANQLNHPVSVYVDPSGNIYVSDQGNNRIQKFASGGGLTYKYFEGSWSSLPDFNSLIPVKTGISGNTDISVRPAGKDDNFAFLWEGYIKINVPGNYTFETVSDDGSKLYFNTPYSATATPTVNSDGVHAAVSATGTVYIAQAGVYPISIAYFEKDGGQQMQTYYTGPGIPRQIIPDAVFTQVPPTATPTPAAANLNYKYYQGGFIVLPDFNALTPVKTGTSSNFDIGIRPPGVNDSFAIVWDGYISIPVPGSYTFETISDDGSKLYFNGTQLVNNDSTHPPKSATGTIIIPSPGVYPIKVAYFENYGDQSFQVLWSGPGITRQQIPDTAFVPAGNATTPTNGLNYKFYQGDFNVLPDFSKLTPVKSGVSSNIDIGVRPAGIDDHFAFMWQGFIHLPSAGTYNFETISDDGSRIYFNSNYSMAAFSVVTNDGVHAATSVSAGVTVAVAGIYSIVITYFEKNGGQNMQFNWSGPGISYGPVPDSAFTTNAPPIPPTTGGLSYKYYEKEFSVLPDFNQLTPVKTGLTENVDITVRNPTQNDQFAFLWQGYINIPLAGAYTFETISDDGSKLYFNTMYNPAAAATVNNDGEHPATSVTGTVNVPTAGWYPIAISYFEKNGGESMEVYWSGPGLARQKIPNSAFSQTPSASVTAPAKTASETVNSVTTDNLTNTRIYPNPFRDGFNMEFYNSSNANNVQVGVYDISGKLLHLKNVGAVPAGPAMLHVTLNGTILPEGVYIARLQINGVPVKTIKLLKIK